MGTGARMMKSSLLVSVCLALLGAVLASHPATPTAHKPFFDNGAGAGLEEKDGDDHLKSVLPLMLMMSMRRNAYASAPMMMAGAASQLGHAGMMWPYMQGGLGAMPPPMHPYANSYGGYGMPGYGPPGMGGIGMGGPGFGMGAPGFGFPPSAGYGAGAGMFYPSNYGSTNLADHQPMFTQLQQASSPGLTPSTSGVF